MYKFLTRLGFFILALVVCYPIFVYASSKIDYLVYQYPYKIKNTKGDYGHMWTRLKEAERVNDVDILILGSSLAYRGIDVRSFDSLGLKAFNLGSSGQTPLQTSFLLDRYLEKMNPRLILWEVSPMSISNPGLESFIDVSSNFGFHPDFLHHLFKLKRIEALHSLTLTIIDQSLYDFDAFEQPKVWSQDTYINGGFVEKIHKPFQRAKPLEKKELRFKDFQEEAFFYCLNKLEKHKVILIISPISEDEYQSISNMENINVFFRNLDEKFPNVDYLNFNEIKISGLITESHFYDEYHLNQKGVSIYNTELINQMNQITVFKNLNSRINP